MCYNATAQVVAAARRLWEVAAVQYPRYGPRAVKLCVPTASVMADQYLLYVTIKACFMFAQAHLQQRGDVI